LKAHQLVTWDWILVDGSALDHKASSGVSERHDCCAIVVAVIS